jgi:signal transduction histidine kinase
VVIAIGSSLAALRAGLPAGVASVLGICTAVIIGLVAVRLHGWAARAVDPAAALRQELVSLGPVPDGEHRLTLQQALRRSVGDPGLLLVVRAADGVWVDAAGEVSASPPDGALGVAGPAGDPVAVVVSRLPGADLRIRRLGDCGALAQPAVLEATALQERSRADSAAAAERARVSQDLHDGLQGRLLGIALNLQLTGRVIDDPSARLLVEQTVASLRDAVEDVRALAGGRLPATLVDHGLRPALVDLVQPLATVVDLQVPDTRFPSEVEATSYFVVGEAVSNAIKHGRAEHVRVEVTQAPQRLTIMVVDDGVGGADPRLGSGLRGLAERVNASGGVLVVRDGVPSGTVVEASLPCGS